jgi:hypothetical protein
VPYREIAWNEPAAKGKITRAKLAELKSGLGRGKEIAVTRRDAEWVVPGSVKAGEGRRAW